MTTDGTGAGAHAAPALSRPGETANGARITLAGAELFLRPSGALYWPDESLLCVGDLHLGRAERLARRGAGLLPPYETLDTLERLAAEVAALGPRCVICLGDSFDDLLAAEGLEDAALARIGELAAGRRWIWVAGNHDPGPAGLPGSYRGALSVGPLAFRHVAQAKPAPGGEVSAHYHPKGRLARRGIVVTRRCFLVDSHRVILPAFGTYTGGLDASDPVFDRLLDREAQAYLLGRTVACVARARLGA